MSLQELLRRVTTQPSIEALAGAIQDTQGAALLRAAPLIGAARVPVVAALATLLRQPLLYIVTNSDAALRASALLVWGTL